MNDHSHLDLKYFVSNDTYNCPFCNRRNVKYNNNGFDRFDWSNSKKCAVWRITCTSCGKTSLHLTFQNLDAGYSHTNAFKDDVELDDAIFYSVPTSFFVIDRRIPEVLRELITEAEGCAKMNYLTGASACVRKAIYELLAIENAGGANYDDKITNLQQNNPNIDKELFEILGHLKDMTSDHVHEQSWEAWDSCHLRMFLETLKAIFHEMYVVPDEKKARAQSVRLLREQVVTSKRKEVVSEPKKKISDKAD